MNNIEDIKNLFLKYLLEGNRQQCLKIATNIIEEGYSIKNLYKNIFCTSMKRIGDLWEKNEISVAHEHLATAIIQFTMASLYGKFFKEKSPHKGKIILTCCDNELHEMGIRMLADLLYDDGWQIIYLGANTPTFSILNIIKQNKPQILGVSCTMPFNFLACKDLITSIKKYEFDFDLKIMVGGRVFDTNPHLIEVVGADGYGNDFDDILKLTNNWLNQKG